MSVCYRCGCLHLGAQFGRWSLNKRTYLLLMGHTSADAVRAIDPTRYVTSAIPMVKDADEPDYAALDVGGYNYSPHRYDVDHAKYPDRVMVGTESFPTSSFEMWDHIWNSSWVVGDFIWTSIDYIGESAIGSAATSPDLQASEGQPWNWHISVRAPAPSTCTPRLHLCLRLCLRLRLRSVSLLLTVPFDCIAHHFRSSAATSTSSASRRRSRSIALCSGTSAQSRWRSIAQ